MDLFSTERMFAPKWYKYLTDKFLNGLDNDIQSIEYFPLYRYEINWLLDFAAVHNSTEDKEITALESGADCF